MFLGLACFGCHTGAGRRAAFGPKIVGQGLSTAIIRTTIENGRGQMPASEASAQALDDIAAYVAILQEQPSAGRKTRGL